MRTEGRRTADGGRKTEDGRRQKPFSVHHPPSSVNFFDRVYAVTRLIPKGTVATYGQIAALLEHPRAARTVGWALHGLPDDLEPQVPWHRVINAYGRISNSSGRHGGAEEQFRRLKREGIKFDRSGRCDLRQYQWEPPLDLTARGG